MFNEGCKLQCSSYLWTSTVHIRVFFLHVLVATIAHSKWFQLETNVAITADSADTSGQDTASQKPAVNKLASRTFVERYLDPLDWPKYYIQYTDSVGNKKLYGVKCPNDLVFNPDTEQCTFRSKGISNSTILQFTEGEKWNEFQGYYCEDAKFTYCTADKLKIVDNQSCPDDTECVRGANNSCMNTKTFRPRNITLCYRLLYCWPK
jgi:hypothetical protein